MNYRAIGVVGGPRITRLGEISLLWRCHAHMRRGGVLHSKYDGDTHTILLLSTLWVCGKGTLYLSLA